MFINSWIKLNIINYFNTLGSILKSFESYRAKCNIQAYATFFNLVKTSLGRRIKYISLNFYS